MSGSRVGGESWVSDTNPEGRERMLYNEIQRTLGGGGRSVGKWRCERDRNTGHDLGF